jgi:NitT/TauT family transport system permease protein
VYAAIIIIGIIGFGSDLLLAKLGHKLFPWDQTQKRG